MAFIEFFEKKENRIKGWDSWIQKEKKELKAIDKLIEAAPQAEAWKVKPTWEYGANFRLQGGPIGKEHKKVPFSDAKHLQFEHAD